MEDGMRKEGALQTGLPEICMAILYMCVPESCVTHAEGFREAKQRYPVSGLTVEARYLTVLRSYSTERHWGFSLVRVEKSL